MKLLGKIFRKDSAFYISQGEEKLRKGDKAGSLIDFEKGLEKLKEENADITVQEKIASKIIGLKDEFADRFISEAEKLIDEGELEGALENLNNALEVGGSENKRNEIKKMIEQVQIKIAEMEVSNQPIDMTDEEVYQALSGGWSQAQIDEFDSYGDKFKRGYLKFHEGCVEEAIVIFRSILNEAGEDALFLRLELGRALQVKASQIEKEPGREEEASRIRQEAIGEINSFLSRLPAKGHGEIKAQAWSLIAQIYSDEKKFEDAEDALMQAQNLLPDEPAVYLNLGRFLLQQERIEDAAIAVEEGIKVMDKLHPNIELIQFAGTVFRKAGKKDEAIKYLQMVLDYYIAAGRLQFDPVVAVPLAELLEEKGKILEACDIYRNLSISGGDENFANFNFHAARLMKILGKKRREILPYIIRARENTSDPELLSKIQQIEKELE